MRLVPRTDFVYHIYTQNCCQYVPIAITAYPKIYFTFIVLKSKMMKAKRIIYWIATGLLSALLLFSPFNYIVNFDIMTEAMQSFNFPAFLIYFLIVTKFFGSYRLTLEHQGYHRGMGVCRVLLQFCPCLFGRLCGR